MAETTISKFKNFVVNRHAYSLLFILLLIVACQKKSLPQNPEELAKNFLISTQEKNGSWDPKKFEGKFEHADGAIAVTALATVALLNYNDNASKSACKLSIQYLQSIQSKDGSIGERNYANGISFYCLAKALKSSDSVKQSNFEVLLKSILQKQSTIGAWDYIEANSDRNDMSISAWVCLGLNLLVDHPSYKKDAYEALIKINKMLYQDKSGAGDDSSNTKAISAYTYGEDPNSASGKVLRSPGTTIQAIILFIKSTVPEFRQSNWVETAKKDQFKALMGNQNVSLYQTFFLLQSKRNGVNFESSWLKELKQNIKRDQNNDGTWPLTSPPIQFGGKIMATAIGLITLNELSKQLQ